MLGRRDGVAAVTREEAIANAKEIVGATDLPVSADFEDGYGPAPADVAATVRAAVKAGLCGCTIEDTTADPENPIHGFDAAVARVAAAVHAARAAPHPFVLTARAENFLHGRPDLDDTHPPPDRLRRGGRGLPLRAGPAGRGARSARGGAAVAPRPVNVLHRPAGRRGAAARLARSACARVSVGGAIARAAYGAALEAGRALARGDMAAIAALTPYGEIAPHMRSGERQT